ncbi:MAG TPA: phage holin family protein [Bacteroidia bacterium]|nr:phage holin family protein [Bacteroidia bacterium]HRD39667.1 phage holin family protein [Bacteroidia bacterium]
MKFLANILISAVAVVITAKLLPGIEINGFLSAILVAVVLAFLNAVVKPILTILTIPITFFTMGLFLLAINAFIIIIADKLIDEFYVRSFWWALLFSFILSITTGLLNAVFGNQDPNNKDQNP